MPLIHITRTYPPKSPHNIADWWFGTWMDYDFPFSWEWNNHPNWGTHSMVFQRDRFKPPTSHNSVNGESEHCSPYPLVNIQKTMENHHFLWDTISMAIFNRKESKQSGNASFLIAIWQGGEPSLGPSVSQPFWCSPYCGFLTHKHPKNQRPWRSEKNWRYRFHMYLAYVSGLWKGISPQFIWPEIWY